MDAEYIYSGLINQWKDTKRGWKLHSITDQIQVIVLDRFILFKQRSLLIQSFKICLIGGNHIVASKEVKFSTGKEENSTIKWSDIKPLGEPLKGLSTLRSSFYEMKGKHLLIMYPFTELKNLGLFKRYKNICILKKTLCLHFQNFDHVTGCKNNL